MIRKTIIVSILTIILTSSIYGWFAFNQTNIAFLPQNPGGETTSLPKGYPSIENLIVKGTGFFLKSHSDILIFLNMIEISELSGIDYLRLQKALDSAIDNLKKAKEIYFQLRNIAAVTPYNPEVIDKLTVFDYDGFQKDRGLNAVIFERVKRLLSNGDVKGAYNLFYEDLKCLFEQINNLKSIIDNERMPEIFELWRINQKYSELQLFGQYVTEVLYYQDERRF